jgi:predicted transcriptional regulator
MVYKRRSEIEIIGELINLTKDGAKKTRILYQNNMSFTQIQKYLTYLIEKKIIDVHIENDNGSSYKIYTATEKGLNLLEDINKVLTYLT